MFLRTFRNLFFEPSFLATILLTPCLEYAELFGVLVIIKQGFPSSFLNSQFFKSSALTFIDIIK
tara:strand:+ start:349 stop:540 length:192 start_codon:yes stop_codon:yes gene_type:complete